MSSDVVPPRGRDGRDVPLAIVGISCIFPQADGLEAYWKNIRNGVDAIEELPETHWAPQDYFNADPKAPDQTYAKRGGFLPPIDFNPLAFGIAPNTLEATDTAQLLGLYTAQKALEDAGYGADREFDRERVSVLLGVTGTLELSISLGARLGHPFWRKALKESGVEGDVAEEIVQRIADSYVEWQEASFPGLLGNVVAGRIANRLDLGGTNCVVDAACASSLSALHLAAMELADGRCDLAITGGVDTLNDIFMYMCFSKTPALSPTGNARPFDDRGDGTILGEGVGILVLKRLDDAVRDGDRIYAEIRGLGTSSDGKGNAIYAPSASGQAKALRRAYARSGIAPETVELVEAHGTGTSVGDAVESEALSAVYREGGAEGSWCALGSVKSQIGHTKAASGVASLIKAAMALHHKVLPPTLKVEQPLAQVAPGASPFYVNTDKRPWLAPHDHPRRAAISSFGFGGSNFHCVLQEHVPAQPAAEETPEWDGDVQVLAFGASTRHGLRTWLDRLAAAPDWDAVRTLGRDSRAAFRPTDAERLLLVIERDELAPGDVARRAVALLEKHREPTWSTPDGVYYGRGAAAGELAFLFPGQGSQYVGMLRDLACRFPQMRHALEEADAAGETSRLSDAIYPHPAFDDAARKDQEEALRDTRTAQPAIGAVSQGAAAVLAHFGVRPAATAGHSFGELTALLAAGRLQARDFHRLARLRGHLMGDARGERGSMLAVRARFTAVEQILREESLDLVVANRNAPEQIVLSGANDEIERAAAILRARQIDARRLDVSAAFHSPFVSDAEQPLSEALRGIEMAAGAGPDALPVYANTTASPYPSDETETRTLLAGQLARPVLFEDLVRGMHAAGVRTFVEVGPHARLAGLVGATLRDDLHHMVSLDASRGARSGIRDLARVLAQIGALGHPIELQPWDASFVPPPAETGTTSLTYAVSGANIRTRKREPMHRDDTNAAQPASASAEPLPPTTSAHADSLREALRVTQQNMAALQQLQQQTAQLHQQFLQGQNASQQHFQALLLQQQRLLDLSMGLPVDAAVPITAPAPLTPIAPLAIPPAPIAAAAVAPMPVAPLPVAPAPVVPAPLPPAATPVAATPAAASDSDVAQILLDIVAEKTGYPADILELGMELDADLGIDSIKRVEILSAVQDALPDAPHVKPDQLGTLRTLQAVLDFIQQDAPVAAPSAAAPPAPAPQPGSTPLPPAAAPRERPLQRSVLQSREFNGSAEESPAPTATDAPLWITDTDPTLARELARVFQARDRTARIVSIAAVKQNGPTTSPVGGLVVLPPQDGTGDDDLLDALRVVQVAGPGLRAAGAHGGATLLTVSRLDGAFGTSGGALADPLSGGLAGLAKCAAHEWPDVRARALDLAPDLDARDAAQAIAEEVFRSGPVEVGLSARGRRGLALVDEALPAPRGSLPIAAGDVVVLSGGARGVTAEVAHALATACRPTLVLLGRTPAPQAEPAWLSGAGTEAEIRQALLAHGGAASPREAGAACRRVQSEREIRANLARLRATGASVHYASADVGDAEAVADALAGVRAELGPVRMLVHGAGVLADQHILDKTEESFRRVYDTKVAGLRNLLAAVEPEELRALVLFSSSTARFGRTGQVDYAVANEVLNKMAWAHARAFPTCKVVSLNWGPWEGGMVDEALRAVFADEGVPLIPLAQGAAHLLDELSTGASAVERLVLGPAPVSDDPRAPTLPLVVTQEIDIAHCPFLRSHVLDGRAVVPMAILPEWLAHGALHGNPGLVYLGFDELQVLKGLVLDAGTRLTLKIHAGKAVKEATGYRVPVELRAAADGGREHLHARADILLAESRPVEKARLEPPAGTAFETPIAKVYAEALFHGPALQGIERLEIDSEEGMLALAAAAPAPRQWMEPPLRRHWLGDPLAVDVGIQLVTFWTALHRSGPSLPCRAGRYRQYRAFPKDSTRVVMRVTRTDEGRAFADMEFLDSDGRLVARMEDCENTIDAGLTETFRSNHLAVEARR